MRVRLPLTRNVLMALSLLVTAPVALLAQPSVTRNTGAQNGFLGSIRDAIVQGIGARAGTVEVSLTRNILNVSRVNSTMNQVGHAARNIEAARIGLIISQAILDRPELSSIHTIRVQYLARSKPGSRDNIVDTIKFGKDASGAFQFHAT